MTISSHLLAELDVEAMLTACVPGGALCDPQHVADSIRQYLRAQVAGAVPPTASASAEALRAAAQAVVERWDSPLWKDLPHTGEYIARLRKALTEVAIGEMVDLIAEQHKLKSDWRAAASSPSAAPAGKPVNSRDCPHCNFTGTVHCGDIADKILANGGTLGSCSNALVYGRKQPAAARVPLAPDSMADRCEAWLQSGGASNVVEAGFREAEHAHGISREGGAA